MYSTLDLQKLVQMLDYLGVIGPGSYPAHSVVLGAGANAAPGTAGTLLASNGVSSDPSFQSLAALGIQPAGSYATLPLPARSVGDSQIAWGSVLARTVDSIAALAALDISVYQRAFVTGYYSAGDGGGGSYYYSASTPGSSGNGGTYIPAAGGVGCWLMEYTMPSFSVKQFGAKVDGSTDDSAKVQALANYLAFIGGGEICIPVGTCCLASSVGLGNRTTMRGAGYDCNHDSGSPNPVSRLLWTGAAGGTLVVIQPPGGATQRMSQNGMTGIYLDSNNGLAAIGLDVYSSNNGNYDIAGNMFTTALFRLSPLSALTAEAPDPQYNTIAIDHRNLSNGGSTAVFAGTATANASFNYIRYIHAVVTLGTQAVVLSNADNNIFWEVDIFGAGGGAAGNAILLGAAGAGGAPARANIFFKVSSNMNVYAQGTEVAAQPSANNQILFWDVENHAIGLTLGTNATCWVGSNHAPYPLQQTTSYASDAAAAAGGITLGSFYQNSGVVHQRLV